VNATGGKSTSNHASTDPRSLTTILWSARELRGLIVDVHPETADSATVTIKPGWGFSGKGHPGGLSVDASGQRRPARDHRAARGLQDANKLVVLLGRAYASPLTAQHNRAASAPKVTVVPAQWREASLSGQYALKPATVIAETCLPEIPWLDKVTNCAIWAGPLA